jgi:hypothetical protein
VTAEQLLAMKVFAARLYKHDLADCVNLCSVLGIKSRFELESVLKKYIKEDSIKSQNRTKGQNNKIYKYMEKVCELL